MHLDFSLFVGRHLPEKKKKSWDKTEIEWMKKQVFHLVGF